MRGEIAMYRLGWIFVFLFIICVMTASAEFYKYVDERGVVRYTDDASRIPVPDMQKVQKYQEAPPQQPAAEETAPPESAPVAGDASQPVNQEAPEVSSDSAGLETGQKADPEKLRSMLEKEKDRLDVAYRNLKKELDDLQREKEAANTKNRVRAYNQRVLALNKKIEAYEMQRQELNEKIKAYNKTAGEEGNK
jgi:hypothetical protein